MSGNPDLWYIKYIFLGPSTRYSDLVDVEGSERIRDRILYSWAPLVVLMQVIFWPLFENYFSRGDWDINTVLSSDKEF